MALVTAAAAIHQVQLIKVLLAALAAVAEPQAVAVVAVVALWVPQEVVVAEEMVVLALLQQ